MTSFPIVNEPQSFYELCWNNTQDGTFAADAATGIVVDVNPAAEAMTGYSRDELVGMHVTTLHPESERARAGLDFQESLRKPSSHTGFHIQRKDGRTLPVAIWSSPPLKLDGRSLVIAEFRDITESEQQEHRLATKRWALAAYAGAALALWQQHTTESLLQTICEAITRESVYVLAWVAIAEEGPGKPIRLAASAGSGADYLKGLHLTWAENDPQGNGPLGVCIRTQEPQIMQDIETFAAFAPWRDRARKGGVRSGVVIPFFWQGHRRGALCVYAANPNTFEAVAIELFQHLAEQIGFGIHAIEQEKHLEAERERTTRAEQQLTVALSGMVAPIITAMEMRDPYTVGHQSRVAEIAVAIGRDMGWTEERLRGLRIAAQVHDIGKISIPAEILTKPGQLNAAERAMINGHAEIGYTILKDIPFPWPVAQIVRQHHEKMDGSGYPLGLKADAILPEAKVLAVADIVEAMVAYRPYRPGFKLHTALQQIEKDAGVLLDPEAVRICVALFREKHLMIPGWTRI